MTLTVQEAESAQARVAFSNTPSFLYRGLRDNPGVQRIAREEAPPSLNDTVFAVDQKDVLTLADAALGYAALVAALMTGDKQVLAQLRARVWRRLVWAEEIVALHAHSAPSTSFASVPGQLAGSLIFP